MRASPTIWPQAVAHADIISCATLAREPFLRGEWLSPGTHVDLVGAFKLNMREADDVALQRARIFIDTERALSEGGEVAFAIASGAIARDHVQGTLAELIGGTVAGRGNAREITLFKSVGTSIADLAVAILIWQRVAASERSTVVSQNQTIVKICGLSSAATLDAALESGADMVGFVFFAPSPRNLSLEQARALAGQVRGRAQKVALTVDADDALLEGIVDALAPDILQLHGKESPERVRAIRARFGIPVMKAIGIAFARRSRQGRRLCARPPTRCSSMRSPRRRRCCPAATDRPSTGRSCRASRLARRGCSPAVSTPEMSRKR